MAAFFAAVVFVKNQALRNPAAIPKVEMFDFSTLDGGELKEAMTKQILRDFEIKKKDSLFEFHFGNFLASRDNGDPQYFCDYFGKITLVFEAEGMASSGDRPQLVVSAGCTSALDFKKSDPVKIPVDLIKKLKATSVDWTYDQQPGVSYSFRNLDGIWPNYWVLSEVKLKHSSDASKDLSLDRYTIYKGMPTPPTMSWE